MNEQMKEMNNWMDGLDWMNKERERQKEEWLCKWGDKWISE